MRTNQLIKDLSTFGIGYARKPRTNRMSFWKDHKLLAVIEDDRQFAFSVDSRNLNELDYHLQRHFLDRLIAYTTTPADWRGSDGLDHRYKINLLDGEQLIMIREPDTDNWEPLIWDATDSICTDDTNEDTKISFTESEYKGMVCYQRRHGFWLPEFDKAKNKMFVPVEDGDEE